MTPTISVVLRAAALLASVAWTLHPPPLPTDLQAFCERLADRAAAAPALRFGSGTVERTITLPGDPRLILGGEWNSTLKTLTVFESADSRVTILDTAGQVLRTFGRHGEGPAEFRLSPMVFGSRQRFRSAPDGRVLVLDERFGHLFAGGAQVQEVHFGESMGPLPTDVHVARVENGWIVSTARLEFSDQASSSIVRLFTVRDIDGPRHTPVQLATIRNGLAPLPPGTTRGHGMPYDVQYRRVWDAMGRNMAVASKRHFALCFGSPADSTSWRAWASKAVQRKVDEAERNRILKERFGRTSGPMPMAGTPVEEVFRGKWPAAGPFYYDVTALNDSTYAAVRLDDQSGVTADLISVARGYLVSVHLPAGRGVIGGYRDGLLLLNAGDGDVEFLRLPVR